MNCTIYLVANVNIFLRTKHTIGYLQTIYNFVYQSAFVWTHTVITHHWKHFRTSAASWTGRRGLYHLVG